MNLTINEISKILDSPIINPSAVGSLSSVSIDTRTVNKGALFVGVKGQNYDGNDFLLEAKKNGAKAFIVSNKINKDYIDKNDLKNVFISADTISSLQHLAGEYLAKLDVKPIVITGSCGKTTVKDILYSVLKERFPVLATEGNLNNYIGVPLNILRLTGNETYCILEVGINSFGELDFLGSMIKPIIGVITNIGKAHLEKLKDLDGVLKAKWEITKHIKDEGFLVINGDDSLLAKKITSVTPSPQSRVPNTIITFGIEDKNDFSAKVIEETNDFQRLIIKSEKYKESWELTSNLLGNVGVYSNLAVIAVCDCLGVKPDNAVSLLSKTNSAQLMRFEKFDVNGVTIINDAYNANPTSMEAGLLNVSKMKIKGKKVVVLGDMLELGSASEMEHRAIGRLIAKIGFDMLICYGEKAEFIGAEVLKVGFDKNNLFMYNNEDEIVKFIRKNSVKGDLFYFKASRLMHIENIILKAFGKNKN